jgi:type IV secretion system protein VirB5
MKKMIALLITSGFFAATANATGIPTVDIAANILTIEKQAADAAAFAAQLVELKNQVEQAKAQFESLRGSRGMAALFSSEAVQSALPPDWESAYSSIKSSASYTKERAALPTHANPKINAIYDSVASSRATMTDFFKKTNARLAQITQLQASIDSAGDPAAKADLQNRLVSEQNSIQATSQLLALLKEKMAQDTEQANTAAHANVICSEFRGSSC